MWMFFLPENAYDLINWHHLSEWLFLLRAGNNRVSGFLRSVINRRFLPDGRNTRHTRKITLAAPNTLIHFCKWEHDERAQHNSLLTPALLGVMEQEPVFVWSGSSLFQLVQNLHLFCVYRDKCHVFHVVMEQTWWHVPRGIKETLLIKPVCHITGQPQPPTAKISRGTRGPMSSRCEIRYGGKHSLKLKVSECFLGQEQEMSLGKQMPWGESLYIK